MDPAGRLSVCLLSNGYPPESTEGVARSTQALALGLREAGHRVCVLTGGGASGERDGVTVQLVRTQMREEFAFLSRAGFADLRHWLQRGQALLETVKDLCSSQGVDVVDSPLWQLEGLATALSRIRPVVVRAVTSMRQIASIHGDVTPEASLMGDLESRFLEAADLVVSNSTATERVLNKVYGLQIVERSHHMVPYGLVPSPESQVVPLPSKGQRNATVLYLGRLEGRKGILTLFQAIPEVLRAAPGTRFVIGGSDNSVHDGFRSRSGVDYPGYFRKTWPAAATQVTFLGAVPESGLRALYRECDLFVAPSVYESFGLVYLEAMDQARPVIACAAGGPEDVVAHGETGLLVPPESPQALADAIVHMLERPEDRLRMGMAGRQRFLQRFTHRTMALGFVDAYRKVAG